MNVFVFDIETIPDVDAGRMLYGHSTEEMNALSDEDVAKVMTYHRYQDTAGQTDMLRQHLQRVIAISAVMRCNEGGKDICRVGSFGEVGDSEAEIIQRFFDTLEKWMPMLVSWNGSGFDLPVLHYRALIHGIQAPLYWKAHGEMTNPVNSKLEKFRFDNYLNRYHDRHTDLMDVLAGFQPRAYVPLDEMATLLKLPGKMGMSGSKVWETYLEHGQQGEVDIRNYCETDTLNTYLVFLRFELMRGHLDQMSYESECERLKTTLQESEQAHLQEFLQAWAAVQN